MFINIFITVSTMICIITSRIFHVRVLGLHNTLYNIFTFLNVSITLFQKCVCLFVSLSLSVFLLFIFFFTFLRIVNTWPLTWYLLSHYFWLQQKNVYKFKCLYFIFIPKSISDVFKRSSLSPIIIYIKLIFPIKFDWPYYVLWHLSSHISLGFVLITAYKLHFGLYQINS